MKKSISIVVFLFIGNFTFSQTSMEKKLKSLMRESVAERENGSIKIASEKAWIFENTDSIYFKQDTVRAYIVIDSKVKSFCNPLYWNFNSRNSIIISQSRLCIEPPRGMVTRYPKGFLKIEVKSEAENIILQLINPYKITEDKFSLIGINESESITEISFARKK